MHQALFRRGLGMAAALSALVLASCETPEPEPPAPPPPPPPPPALALNSGISEAAAIYVAFMREARTIDPAITDAATIELIMTRGASYESNQLSRGMIAYGAILALQSTAFVEGVRTYAADPDQRRQVIERIQIDPAYAAPLPGPAAAAGRISGGAADGTSNPPIQRMIANLRVLGHTVDVDDEMATFGAVFGALPEAVKVYPTENYHYFSFYAGGVEYGGNLRLDAADRVDQMKSS